MLKIGRQTRAQLYNFMVQARRPLIAEGLTFGVNERLNADGSILEPLLKSEITRLIAALRTHAIDSVAICLLHSYANPAHEDKLCSALEDAGFLVSASHKILPEYREFERWSTTVVNAYVTPLMARYLTSLEEGLDRRQLRIMQSNGGSISGVTREKQQPSKQSSPVQLQESSERRQSPTPRATLDSSPSTWEAPPPTSASSTNISAPQR